MRLTAFTVRDDGTLTDRRTYAELVPERDDVPVAPPDGICLDAEGAVWVADPIGARVFRVREGGEVTDSIALRRRDPGRVRARRRRPAHAAHVRRRRLEARRARRSPHRAHRRRARSTSPAPAVPDRAYDASASRLSGCGNRWRSARGGRERLPRALGLREAVGDRDQRRRVVAEPAVAAVHLDVLRARTVVLEAPLPARDAVGAAVDRGGGHLEQRLAVLGAEHAVGRRRRATARRAGRRTRRGSCSGRRAAGGTVSPA